MSERLAKRGHEGAELLTSVINNYFGQMLDLAASHGGANLKFGGDALLLLFQGPHHAVRAAATALEMQVATRQFRVQNTVGRRLRLGMSAGLHSGQFWSLTAGSPNGRMQHFLMGKDAGICAQAEQAANAGEIALSRNTLMLLHNQTLAEPRGEFFVLTNGAGINDLDHSAEIKDTIVPVLDRVSAFLSPTLWAGGRLREQAGDDGEHRSVTVVFVKLTGVNELASNSGPGALIKQLQPIVAKAADLASRYGGYLVSNDIDATGIKLILTFGAPLAHEDDLQNAGRFAISLRDSTEVGSSQFEVQVGVNSGFIFAGDVGSPIRREYTVMGDAVNLSARLMAHCPKGSILVSGTFADNLGKAFELTSLDPISVKGKRNPVPVALLVSEKAGNEVRMAAPETPFVGRKDELRRLTTIAARIRRGSPGSVVVVGPTGIGKTRLIDEFSSKLVARDWTVIQGACYSHASNIPLSPWKSIISEMLELNPADHRGVRSAAALARISEISDDLTEVGALLNPLLDTQIASSDLLDSLSPSDALRRFNLVIESIVRHAAGKSPLALIFEDLHWADPSTVHLLETVIRDIDQTQLLVVATMRSGNEDVLSGVSEVSHSILVPELGTDAVHELVGHLFGHGRLPARFERAIEDKAQGNPLFLVELAASLSLDRMSESAMTGFMTDTSVIGISDRLQAILMARIDALGTVPRELLKAVSVIGRDFDLATALVIDNGSEKAVGAGLQELVRQQILETGAAAGGSYHFRHALAQEVAYGSLPFRRRRELHRKVAIHLESSGPDELDANSGLLAYHYLNSGDKLKTTEYSIRAAVNAGKVFAHEEAIINYRRALEVTSHKGAVNAAQRSYLHERIADVMELAGDHQGAIHEYDSSLRYWHSTNRQSSASPVVPSLFDDGIPVTARESVLRMKSAISNERDGLYERALGMVETAEHALPSRLPRVAARVGITRCVVHFRKGEYPESLLHGVHALRIACRIGAQDLTAYCQNMLGSSLVELGQLHRALKHRLSAAKLYEFLHDVPGQATAHNNLATCYQQLGDLSSASHEYEKSLAACRRLGDPSRVAIVTNNMGEVLLMRGLYDDAERSFRQVVSSAGNEGMSLALRGLAFVNLSRCAQRRNDLSSAEAGARQAIALLKKSGAEGLLLEAEVQLLAVRSERANPRVAQRSCAAALARSRSSKMQLLEARLLHAEGTISKRLGDRQGAERSFRASANLAGRIGSNFEKGQALKSLGLLFAEGDPRLRQRKRARSALRRAVAIFERAGATREATATQQLIGIMPTSPRKSSALEGDK